MRIWWGHALLVFIALSWISCAGPARHPAPLVPEIGADPVPPPEEESDPSARGTIKQPAATEDPTPETSSTEAATATEEARPAESAATPASDKPIEKVGEGDSPAEPAERAIEAAEKKPATSSEKPSDPAQDYEFLVQVVMDVAGRADEEKSTIAVFPAAHINPLFGRLEVSQLGWELGQFVDKELRKEITEPFKILSPTQFAKELHKTNRSLADITRVEDVFQLARRVGVNYLVVGMIYDGDSKFEIAYDCIDMENYFKISINKWPYEATDPLGKRLYRKFKDDKGQAVLTDAYQIGARAEPHDRDLAAELNWLFARAMRDIVGASGPVLKDLPIAVLPVRLPEDLNFLKFQSMFLTYIESAKKELAKEGKSETEIMADGPHRILGKTFATLREAEEYARELVLQKKTSKAGNFQSTISRILFDQLEKLEKEFGVQVVKHEDVVNEALDYTQEELAKVGRGELDEEKRNSFQAKGAGALLFSEFLEGESWFEFYFQLRRVDDLGVLHARLRAVLEPEFGYKLKNFLDDSGGEKKR